MRYADQREAEAFANDGAEDVRWVARPALRGCRFRWCAA